MKHPFHCISFRWAATAGRLVGDSELWENSDFFFPGLLDHWQLPSHGDTFWYFSLWQSSPIFLCIACKFAFLAVNIILLLTFAHVVLPLACWVPIMAAGLTFTTWYVGWTFKKKIGGFGPVFKQLIICLAFRPSHLHWRRAQRSQMTSWRHLLHKSGGFKMSYQCQPHLWDHFGRTELWTSVTHGDIENPGRCKAFWRLPHECCSPTYCRPVRYHL